MRRGVTRFFAERQFVGRWLRMGTNAVRAVGIVTVVGAGLAVAQPIAFCNSSPHRIVHCAAAAARPAHHIVQESAGTWAIDPAAITCLEAELKDCPHPLHVTSVLGRPREGKSTLCNRLTTDGSFPVGHDHNSVTKGVWAVVDKSKPDEGTHIYFDFEGIFDIQKTGNEKLLGLALLCSSQVVWNTRNAQPTNDDPDALIAAGKKVAKRLRSLGLLQPELTFVLRDSVKESNAAFQQLASQDFREMFPKIGLVPFPDFTKDENRPKIQNLLRGITQSAPVKTLGGRPASAEEWIKLVRVSVDALRNGEMDIESIRAALAALNVDRCRTDLEQKVNAWCTTATSSGDLRKKFDASVAELKMEPSTAANFINSQVQVWESVVARNKAFSETLAKEQVKLTLQAARAAGKKCRDNNTDKSRDARTAACREALMSTRLPVMSIDDSVKDAATKQLAAELTDGANTICTIGLETQTRTETIVASATADEALAQGVDCGFFTYGSDGGVLEAVLKVLGLPVKMTKKVEIPMKCYTKVVSRPWQPLSKQEISEGYRVAKVQSSNPAKCMAVPRNDDGTYLLETSVTSKGAGLFAVSEERERCVFTATVEREMVKDPTTATAN